MVTAAIVQARLGSTRLPAKVLLPLPTGRTVLEEVFHRCGQIPGVDVVVCAIPDTPDNDILLDATCIIDRWVRGPEQDVLARYAKAAEAAGADVIMRITADCPLINPIVCHSVLSEIEMSGVDYASNTMPRTWPQGLDCQVFTRNLLKRADVLATDPDHREHVCPWMERVPTPSKRANVTAPEDRSQLRWTLDTLEDYVRIYRLMQEGAA